MKLIDAKDWKAVHFGDRTILRSDRNLYPEPTDLMRFLPARRLKYAR